MNLLKIFPGKLIFTSTRKSILGKVVEGSESVFLGYTIRQRILPELDSKLRPTKKTHKVWEIQWGNQSWFEDTLFATQMRVLELGGWRIECS